MRRAGLLAINVAVFVALAEAAALLLHYWTTGRLFYTHVREYPVLEDAGRGALTADGLHPYFGPINNPGVRPDTNNFGFASPYNFPFERGNDRQFLIGLFGGSVARQFCDSGVPRLVEHLRRSDRLRDRQPVPLCFAHEGYKQPQQLLVLAYFLSIGQAFDLVINIDGFNEVALGARNHERGWDVSMPSPLHLDPLINLIDRSTMTPEMVASLAAISRDKERLHWLGTWIGRVRLASAGVALDRYYVFLEGRYRAEAARYASLSSNPSSTSLVVVTRPVRPRDGAAVYEDAARNWAAASRLMHDLLAARSVPFVHVLQPSQYFGARRFGAEEDRLARNPASPFRVHVEAGYPALVRMSASLVSLGYFLDATPVFDGEPERVYRDDCCHYNQRGNEILADAIGRFLGGHP